MLIQKDELELKKLEIKKQSEHQNIRHAKELERQAWNTAFGELQRSLSEAELKTDWDEDDFAEFYGSEDEYLLDVDINEPSTISGEITDQK